MSLCRQVSLGKVGKNNCLHVNYCLYVFFHFNAGKEPVLWTVLAILHAFSGFARILLPKMFAGELLSLGIQ